MDINLINILQKSFTEKSFHDISKHVGINPESTKNGLKAIIPVVLASILGNNTVSSSAQPIWWDALDKEYPYSEDEFVDTEKINIPSFLVKGREVLSGMFRTNHDEIIASVSSVGGIQKEKASGLIEVSVPVIVGYLKNWVLKKGWRFNDLIESLIDNKLLITNALPNGITPAHFGVGEVGDVERVNKIDTADSTDNIKDDFSETVKTEIPIEKNNPTKKKKNNGLIWFGGLLVLALLLWYFMGNRACTRSLNTDDTLVPEITNVARP